MIADLELILNADGSTYHLNLLPEDLASTIIFVGNPDGIREVSCYFDHIEVKKINVILANQVYNTFVEDPKKIITEAIKYVLERI